MIGTSRLRLAGVGLTAGAILLAAPATVAAAGSAAPAQTAPTYTTTTAAVPAAAGWLATQFVDRTHLPAPDGDHFDSKYGSSYFPDYGENADVLFGLAAAHGSSAATSRALGYLEQHIDGYADIRNRDGYGPYDGSVGKAAVAAIVAGGDPSRFGGFDLMSSLRKDECPAISTTCTPGAAANIYASISESFVILAESRAGGANAPSAAAANYFLSLQCAGGGFTDLTKPCNAGAADLDSTSYAIMALQALGGHRTQLAKAVSWLQSQQHGGSYWISQGGPNTDSTGLAVAALAGVGAEVAGPRAWLLSQQVPVGKPGAGALRYQGTFVPTTTSATSPSVIATAQALTGLAADGSLAVLKAGPAAARITMFPPALMLSPAAVRKGTLATATGAGFVAGEKVRAVLHSSATTLGTATAAADGTVTVRYRVPASTGAGSHTVLLLGLTSGLSASRSLTVAVAPASGPPSSGTPSSGAPSSGARSSAVSTGTAAVSQPAAFAAPATAEPLAATGQDRQLLDQLSMLGAAAILLGAGLLLLGRRRAH